jgi:hypothetical protein
VAGRVTRESSRVSVGCDAQAASHEAGPAVQRVADLVPCPWDGVSPHLQEVCAGMRELQTRAMSQQGRSEG